MNSIKPTESALAHKVESDESLQSPDVQLANELLTAHLADEEKQVHTSSQATSMAPEAFLPLSKDDFKSILDTAQHIKDRNELNDLKQQQEQYINAGRRIADALVAESDIVSPAAQARILEVYNISPDIFALAKAERKLGEGQNDLREALAESLGLPANSSRGFIQAEQRIASRCDTAKSELNMALKTLEFDTSKGIFRDDIIEENGVLRFPYMNNNKYGSWVSTRTLELGINARHLDYSANDITFPAALDIMRRNSPAFNKFLQELPESVEVVGKIQTWTNVDRFFIFVWTSSIELWELKIQFKLKGYAESKD